MKRIFLSIALVSSLYSYEYTTKVHPFGMYLGAHNSKQHTDIDLADCVVNNNRNNKNGRDACFQLYQIFNIDDHFNRTDADDEQRIIINWGFNWDYAQAKLDYQRYIVNNFGSFNGEKSSHHTDSRRFRENVFCVNYQDKVAGKNHNPSDYQDFISHQKSNPYVIDSYKNTELDFSMSSYFYDESYIQDVFKEFKVNTTGKIIVLASSLNSPFSFYLSEQLNDGEKGTDAYRFANNYLGYQHGSVTNYDSERLYNEFVKFMASKGCKKNYDNSKYASKIPMTLDENEVGATLNDNAYYTNDECARYSEQFFLKNNALYSPKEFIKGNAKWGFLANQYFINHQAGLGKCYTFNTEYYDGYDFSSYGYYNDKNLWKSNESKTYDLKALRLRNFIYNNNKVLDNARFSKRFSPFKDTNYERVVYSIHKTRNGIENEKAIYKEVTNSRDCIIKIAPGVFDFAKDCKNTKYKKDGMKQRTGIMPMDIDGKQRISERLFSLHLRPTSFKEEYKYYKDNARKFIASVGDIYAHLKYPKYFTADEIVRWGKEYGDGRFPDDSLIGFYKNNPVINANFKFLFYPDADKTEIYFTPSDNKPVVSFKVADKLYPLFNKLPNIHIKPLNNNNKLEKRYDYTKTKDGNFTKCCDKDLSKYYIDLNVQISTLTKKSNAYEIKKAYPNVVYKEIDLDYSNEELLEYLVRSIRFNLDEPALIKLSVERIYDNDKRPMFERDSNNIIKGISEEKAFILTDEEIIQKEFNFGSIWNDKNTRPSIKDLNDKKAKIANDTYTRVAGNNVYIGFTHEADRTRVSFYSHTASSDDSKRTKILVYDKDDVRVNPDNQNMGDFVIEFINVGAGLHDICYEQTTMQGEVLNNTCKSFMVRPAKITISDFSTQAGNGLKGKAPISNFKASILDYNNNPLVLNIGIKEAKLNVKDSSNKPYSFDLETKDYYKVSKKNPIVFNNSGSKYNFDMVIAYPLAGDGLITFTDNDYVGSDITNKKCNNISYSTNLKYLSDREIDKTYNLVANDGKIACHIPIIPSEASFTSKSTTLLDGIKTSEGLSDAVLFSDEVVGFSEFEKCLGINCDFTHSLNIPLNIKNKGSSNKDSLEYVYKYFDKDIDVEFDLKFLDNNDAQASKRYRVFTNKLALKDINILNQNITMILSANKDILNKLFDTKMKALDDDVNIKLNTLSSVAKDYEANESDLEFITKIGYTKFQETKDLAPSKNILSKPNVNEFSLNSSSAIRVDGGDWVSFSKDYSFIYAYSLYKDLRAPVNSKIININPTNLDLKYTDKTGNASTLYNSKVSKGHYYLKPVVDIVNEISFKSDYNSKITKLPNGVVSVELTSDKDKNEYVKDLIRTYSKSEVSSDNNFSIEYTKK